MPSNPLSAEIKKLVRIARLRSRADAVNLLTLQMDVNLAITRGMIEMAREGQVSPAAMDKVTDRLEDLQKELRAYTDSVATEINEISDE